MGAAVKGAPRQWPLFSAPVISSLRIINVKEKGGTLVSNGNVMAVYNRVADTLQKLGVEFDPDRRFTCGFL